MDEQERDYLTQQIHQLERSNRRWRFVSLTLAAVFVIFAIVSGASSFMFSAMNMQRQREALMQAEQARAAAEAARLQAAQAEQAARQVDKDKGR